MVVGGCGFLGRHLVEGLVERGYKVRVFDLRTTFSMEEVEFSTGDLCKKEVYITDISLSFPYVLLYLQDLLPILEGASIVFHTASPPPSCNNR